MCGFVNIGGEYDGGETGANAKYSWNVLMGMGSCTVAQVAALL
jgi:hypothetical protein